MMLSWAQLNLNLKCQQLTLIKQSGTLTLRCILHGMSSSLIFDREEFHFSWVLLSAPKKLSKMQQLWWWVFIFECLYTLVMPLKYLVWITLMTVVEGTLLGPCGAVCSSSQFGIYFDNISGETWYRQMWVFPTHVQSVGFKPVLGSKNFTQILSPIKEA